MKADYAALLKLAAAAARAAAKELDVRTDARVLVHFERDVKILADRKLNTLIRDSLAKTGYPILSEEDDPPEGGNSGVRWIIDPLDGSLNYSRSIPMYCISIALWNDMEPVLGLVYDIARDEMFSAHVGGGAWLNGSSITVSGVRNVADSVLCTGFPAQGDFTPAALELFVNQIQAFKKLRLLGSAALSLAYVAAGRADAYQENDIAIWDVAGGLALVTAAGGSISITPGRHRFRYSVKAGAPLLSDATTIKT